MEHDEYWRKTKAKACRRLAGLFTERTLASVVGGDGAIHCPEDAARVLGYVLRHGDACERAVAIVSASELVHSMHELHEHGSAE